MLTVKEVVECNRCCCSPALTLFFCSFYYQNTIFFTLHFVLSRLSRNFQPILSRVLFSIPHAVQEGLWGLGSLILSLLFPFLHRHLCISMDGQVIDYQRTVIY